jgi:WD40 repeat protein
MVVSGSGDRTARLWDPSTGKPIGPPLDHETAVTAVGFDRGGTAVLTRTEEGAVRRWAVAREASGPDERFILWTQVITAAEIDSSDVVRGLGSLDWLNRRNRLLALSGRPLAGDVPDASTARIDH